MSGSARASYTNPADRDERRDTRRRPDDRNYKPRYDRDRSRSRSPPRHPRDDRQQQNHRTRSPFRSRAPPSGPRKQPHLQAQPKRPEIKWELLPGEDEEAMLARIMGFQGFKTTKNTKVPGNDKNYAVHKVKKAEYRQYMNRVGGFNRPLSPGRK